MLIHSLYIPHPPHPRGRRYCVRPRHSTRLVALMYIRPPSGSSRGGGQCAHRVKWSCSIGCSSLPSLCVLSLLTIVRPMSTRSRPVSLVFLPPCSGRHFLTRSTYRSYTVMTRTSIPELGKVSHVKALLLQGQMDQCLHGCHALAAPENLLLKSGGSF